MNEAALFTLAMGETTLANQEWLWGRKSCVIVKAVTLLIAASDKLLSDALESCCGQP